MTNKKEMPNAMACLVKAQGQLSNIEKKTDNPFFKTKYASLNDVLDAVRPVLAKNDLACFQAIVHRESVGFLQTRILHIDGTVFQDDGVPLEVEEKGGATMQRLGSAITYARRYGLMAALNITSADTAGDGAEDDDGEGAQDNWAGPLPKTKLAEAARKLASDINQSETVDELNKVQMGAMTVIEQLQHDWPTAYYGDPESQDGEVIGARQAIINRREELAKETETVDDIVERKD